MDDKKRIIIVLVTIIIAVILIALTIILGASKSETKPAKKKESVATVKIKGWEIDTPETIAVNGETVDNEAVYPNIDEIEKKVVIDSNRTKIDGLEVTLKKTGDYVKYLFQLVNEGEKEAEQTDFSYGFGCQSQVACEIGLVEANIACTDNNELENRSNFDGTLSKGEVAYCELVVKYKEPEEKFEEEIEEETEEETKLGTQGIKLNAFWEWK